jgi:HAD superfamily hydrolase (TIGR01509 family)
VRAHDLEVFARELQPIPHIKEALERIALPVCVASSGAPEKIRHSLTVTGLLEFFDPHLFSAHMVANGKPAPDVFLFAAERMTMAPEACCVIEDSEAGIQGALAAGMRVLGFAGGGHAGPDYADMLRKCGPHAVFDDMRDLPGLLGIQPVTSG